MLDNLSIISAGAGSGKTYRLTQELLKKLKGGKVRASGLIATTFTRKAAAELQERVRVALLSEGMSETADELANALIGTVHSLGVKLLQRFAYEAGVSPAVSIIADEDQQIMFNEALAQVLHMDRVAHMDRLVDRLGLRKRNEDFDWRRQVRQLVEIARANDFSREDLIKSRDQSYQDFIAFLPEEDGISEQAFYQEFAQLLEQTIEQLPLEGDTTKKTESLIALLQKTKRLLQQRGYLSWHECAKLAKASPGTKSKEAYVDFQTFCWCIEALSAFRADCKAYIDDVFDTAIAAIHEFDTYKKSRGLIDYTDMEVLVNRLLDEPVVKEVLQQELDLLMVDEFQDTSPIQLEIFLKLSKLARQSIWVGDPKQSIYGFRGAEPRLMQAIVAQTGGVKAENILGESWRSRQEIVDACNAIFTKAFKDLPEAQVALAARRVPKGKKPFPAEPDGISGAIHHWHFMPEDGGKLPNRDWLNRAIAQALVDWLATGPLVLPKGEQKYRRLQPGDVAILCRSNRECELMARALHEAGLMAAIARTGLLETAEAKLVLACLKYILEPRDSLSVAEILRLGAGMSLEDIVEHRMDYLEERDQAENKYSLPAWAAEEPSIKALDGLREQAGELSAAELLNLVIEIMDLRRTVMAWGRGDQRLSNLDQLRKMALDYEAGCNRMQTAASLGGLLLWMNDQASRAEDMQGASANEDSVNVLTYHRSKGLEWPAVICHSLEQDLRADVFGFAILQDQQEVDLEQLLAHRHIQFWVNPYADQDRRTPLMERIGESDIQKQFKTNALEEEVRLLYVGLTRARDYLIFPSRNKNAAWLNRVCNEGDSAATVLDEHTHETAWDWEGRYVDKKTQILMYPRIFTHAEPKEKSINYLSERAGISPQDLPYQINAKEENQNLVYTTNDIAYLTVVPKFEGVDNYLLGKARKAFFMGDLPGTQRAKREAMASQILDRYDLSPGVGPQDLVDHSEAWQQLFHRNWPTGQINRLVPVSQPKGKRFFNAIIDWLIELPNGIIIIQNSSYSGEHNQTKLPELAHFLHLAQDAVEAASGKKVIQTYIHFINQGQLVKLSIS